VQVERKFSRTGGTADLRILQKLGACRVGTSSAQVLVQVQYFGKTRAQEFMNTAMSLFFSPGHAGIFRIVLRLATQRHLAQVAIFVTEVSGCIA
jgi:hypothetical protein